MKIPYIHDLKIHNCKSAKVLVPILIDLLKPKSVIDIGCGLGDWLYIFQQHGVKEILGIDGEWVDNKKLYIDPKYFESRNLNKPLTINQKFDLVLSLEVAEHLSNDKADIFIETITNLSDQIIFSAAVPGQGGQNHINEQWHSYWIKKFSTKGFHCHDIIRPIIWENINIDYWYKQNMFLFSRNKNDSLF